MRGSSFSGDNSFQAIGPRKEFFQKRREDREKWLAGNQHEIPKLVIPSSEYDRNKLLKTAARQGTNPELLSSRLPVPKHWEMKRSEEEEEKSVQTSRGPNGSFRKLPGVVPSSNMRKPTGLPPLAFEFTNNKNGTTSKKLVPVPLTPKFSSRSFRHHQQKNDHSPGRIRSPPHEEKEVRGVLIPRPFPPVAPRGPGVILTPRNHPETQHHRNIFNNNNNNNNNNSFGMSQPSVGDTPNMSTLSSTKEQHQLPLSNTSITSTPRGAVLGGGGRKVKATKKPKHRKNNGNNNNKESESHQQESHEEEELDEDNYAMDDEAASTEGMKKMIERFEELHPEAQQQQQQHRGSLGSSTVHHHSVTSVDAEASVRVLKIMFQLNLTKNSVLVARLKEVDRETLEKRIFREMGHKKQMTRDEFHYMVCRVLRDDYINKRDASTLFSVFDDDKSGLVDANEFVHGLLSLISSGVNDIAFKFLTTLMEGREKSTMNAFISRFELQVLISCAKSHYDHDPTVGEALDALVNSFSFSHYKGRIPVVHFRDRIFQHPYLKAIFEGLPNPSASIRDIHPGSVYLDKNSETEWMKSSNILADQYVNPHIDVQQGAEENDAPRWWTQGGVVFKASNSNPFPQPVFKEMK